MINKDKAKKWLIFIGILFLFIFLDLGIALVILMLKNTRELTLVEEIVVILVKYAILLIIFILLYKKYLKEKWFDFKKNFKKYFEISFRNWFVGFLIMIVSNVIINSLVKGLGQNESNVQELIMNAPFLAFILTTIGAPFIEEMIFRKSLQDCFNNKVIYMVMSGFLFGLIHVMGTDNLYEYLLIIPYGALGFMFAKTINETDNIYSTIIIHMLHNGVLTLLYIL